MGWHYLCIENLKIKETEAGLRKNAHTNPESLKRGKMIMKVVVSLTILFGLILSSGIVSAQTNEKKCSDLVTEYNSCKLFNEEFKCRGILYQQGKDICFEDYSDPSWGGDLSGPVAGHEKPSYEMCKARLFICRLLPFIAGCSADSMCDCDSKYSQKCTNQLL